MIRLSLRALPALLLFGCAATIGPRFSPPIAASFARDEMRRMETPSLVVYYPAHARERITPILERLEACAQQLRALPHSDTERDKLVVLITSAEFNNAFVRARISGNPTEMVLPVQTSAEVFNLFDFGVTNVGDIACHEAVHYVQLEQTDGFWRVMNAVFGDLYSPNLFTETWFIEGLATWLEGSMGHRSGRPHSPLWTGMYTSGVTAAGEVQAGWLNPAHRELYPFGGNYVTGSHFVAWLAETYGEDKLWALIDRQGRSIFSPLGVTLRFRTVYGRTIGALLDEYETDVRKRAVPRPRPAGQQVLAEDVGYFARLASSPDGALAVLWAGLDEPPQLEVREADGRLRFRTRLTRVLPGRPWILTGPTSISGLSFTADGRWLFFMGEDVAVDGESTYELRQFDARTGEFVNLWEGLRGLGGAVAPDGKSYVFVEVVGGRPELARLDLATGDITRLTALGSPDALGAPAISPDGRRIAFSRRSTDGFDLYLREDDGTIRQLTDDGQFNYGARWMDDDTLVFLRRVDGRAQAHTYELSTGAIATVTDAPYAAFDPVPAAGGRIAFLNRDGWRWSVDVATPAPRPLPDSADDLVAPPLPGATTRASLLVEEDAPYSGWDELLIPRLRAPSAFSFQTGEDGYYVVGLALQGFDRLGWHQWALNASYNSDVRRPVVSAAYGNSLLAPWHLSAVAQYVPSRTRLFGEADGTLVRIGVRETTDWRAQLRASRPFWTTQVAFGAEALRRHNTYEMAMPGTERPDEDVQLIGPSAALSWFAGESTPYAGTRRALSADFSVAAYPRALGSDFNLVDGRAVLGSWIPLPLLDRHTFAVSIRGRAVLSPADGLLQVGGVPGTALYVRDPGRETPDAPPGLVLPGLAFTEPLRGFEDVGFRANAVGIVSARYRYPFIIDRGTTSTLWIGPSFFLRQFEIEAFFEGARTDERTSPYHAAAGGLVRARFVFGSAFPVSLYYQYAHRLDPGLGSQHVIGFALD